MGFVPNSSAKSLSAKSMTSSQVLGRGKWSRSKRSKRIRGTKKSPSYLGPRSRNGPEMGMGWTIAYRWNMANWWQSSCLGILFRWRKHHLRFSDGELAFSCHLSPPVTGCRCLGLNKHLVWLDSYAAARHIRNCRSLVPFLLTLQVGPRTQDSALCWNIQQSHIRRQYFKNQTTYCMHLLLSKDNGNLTLAGFQSPCQNQIRLSAFSPTRTH